jgi:hypothetical protein
MTRFFVPGASSDEAELVYARLAAGCGREVPLHYDRIHEIHWTQDSDSWVASVGQTLRGRRVRVRRRGGEYIEIAEPLQDLATVRAIFPGTSYLVVTDARRLGPFVSYWHNPFVIGEPTVIVKFTA